MEFALIFWLHVSSKQSIQNLSESCDQIKNPTFLGINGHFVSRFVDLSVQEKRDFEPVLLVHTAFQPVVVVRDPELKQTQTKSRSLITLMA